MISYIDISQFKEYTGCCRSIQVNDVPISFDSQKTGYGYKYFMECPACKKRRTRLYQYENRFICRECLQSVGIRKYKSIKNVTSGGRHYIDYVIRRYAVKHGIELIYEARISPDGNHIPYKVIDFDYRDYLPRKPKGRHNRTWERDLAILQALFDMRKESIASNRTFNVKDIRAIVRCK